MMIRLTVMFLFLMALSACDSPHLAKSCPKYPIGSPKVVLINIVYTPNAIISPPRACARPGDVLRFMLSGNPNVLVAVKGKTATDSWIKGGGNNKWFYVIVPHNLLTDPGAEKTYNYKISTVGSPDLDPEVRIRSLY